MQTNLKIFIKNALKLHSGFQELIRSRTGCAKGGLPQRIFEPLSSLSLVREKLGQKYGERKQKNAVILLSLAVFCGAP